MAALTETSRQRCANQVMRDRKFGFRALLMAALPTLTKADWKTAVDDVDVWTETVSVKNSFNAALSEPFKSAASADEKYVLLAAVLLRKAGIFTAEED